MRTQVRLIVTLLVAALLAGCSSRELYDSTQSLRADECRRQTKDANLSECLREARKPYEVYDKERREATQR